MMTEETPIDAAIRDAAARLAELSESPRLDAELLVARAIDMPRSYLFAHPDDRLDAGALERLERSLRRRERGEPMAYITGTREFWSLELIVSPATLVPRPETEILVEVALRDIPRRAEWPVLDLGTGSGAIALALARERRLCRIVGVDISAEALTIAKENARQLLLDNVEFLAGDWTAPLAGRRFPLVVSNPPYVAEHDPALGKLRSEPQLALVSGSDGLDAIRRIAGECRGVMEPGGRLYLEHGADQAPAVAAILESYGWEVLRCYDDYSGHPRVTGAIFQASEAK